jgi:hypothetical protein
MYPILSENPKYSKIGSFLSTDMTPQVKNSIL